MSGAFTIIYGIKFFSIYFTLQKEAIVFFIWFWKLMFTTFKSTNRLMFIMNNVYKTKAKLA